MPDLPGPDARPVHRPQADLAPRRHTGSRSTTCTRCRRPGTPARGQWTQQKRVRFANDVDRELVATWGPANQAKENSTPSEWLPPREAYHCTYVLTYLKVAVHYGLSVTEADVATMRDLAAGC